MKKTPSFSVWPIAQHFFGAIVLVLLLAPFVLGVLCGACRLAFRVGFSIGHDKLFTEFK